MLAKCVRNCLSVQPSFLSYFHFLLLCCLVWLHEQHQGGKEAFHSNKLLLSCWSLSFSIFCLSPSLSAILCPLVGFCLVSSLTNTGTSVYLGLCFLWMFVSLILSVSWHAPTNAADIDSTPERPQSPILAQSHFIKVTSSHLCTRTNTLFNDFSFIVGVRNDINVFSSERNF